MARIIRYKAFAQQIEDVRSGQSTELFLNDNDDDEFTELPDEVFELKNLETLQVNSRSLRVISDRMRELPNLKTIILEVRALERIPDMPGLTLGWNTYVNCRKMVKPAHIVGLVVRHSDRLKEIIDIPNAITGLPELNRIHIFGFNDNQSEERDVLEAILLQLYHSERLRLLQIGGVRLGQLLKHIRQLRQLRILVLRSTQIKRLPSWISELYQLTMLELDANELSGLPDSLMKLVHLSELDISFNKFHSIPDIIFRMKALRRLGLAHNGPSGTIREIPASILELTNLETLDITGHKIETPPTEIVRHGVEAIKNYWRQQQETGIDYLSEAKLLIIGEGGAGKTSLAKKLHDDSFKLRPTEASTEGIEVIHWVFPTSIRVKKEKQGDQNLSRNFQVNTWDFGGQEIYHATHQFFLTRRSLYVLVADDRKEDTDFDYWLQIVELLSDKSPLLVVQNERQGRRREIDIDGLRKRYPNIRGHYAIDLATNRGLVALKDAIRNEIEHLPHIGVALPATWRLVREKLEVDRRDHVTLNEFLDICETEGFKSREDKLLLSGYLHDLGICLHFQDDEVLKKTVILKPKWGTDAVYRVLDDQIVRNNRGRITQQDLERIWFEPHYQDMRAELLHLMMRFKLCYAVPGGNTYIAPQLLSASRLDYSWPTKAALSLQYEYDFMPKGMLTRLIVALHSLIVEQRLVWKTGVVLEREGTRAQVIEEYGNRRITVHMTGRDTSGLLAIVDHELEQIHNTFVGLKYRKLLSCNCLECKSGISPGFFALADLEHFASHGHKIQCRRSFKSVDAAAMLRDLFPGRGKRNPRDPGELGLGTLDDCALRTSLEPAKEVFVSYPWSPSTKALVERLKVALRKAGIVLNVDREEVEYKDSIKEFMLRLAQGHAVLLLLSDEYFQKECCMFELTELAKNAGFRDRIFPILLDKCITESVQAARYIQHWEAKHGQLEAELKKISARRGGTVKKQLKTLKQICDMLPQLAETLADMNALPLEQHEHTDFEALVKQLKERLAI